jgi:drug/metabolite transporter (DMT)-like permease
VNIRKYLVLLAVMSFGGTGDVLLKRGMMDVGPIDLHRPLSLLGALADPWILIGIVCLTCFFASYLTALSWADLSYVLPATAMGYVVVATLSRFFLHEHVSSWRWLGILLVSCGVGWVTRGPALTAQTREARIRAGEEQHEIA